MIVHLLSIITIGGRYHNMSPLNNPTRTFGDMRQCAMRGRRALA